MDRASVVLRAFEVLVILALGITLIAKAGSHVLLVAGEDRLQGEIHVAVQPVCLLVSVAALRIWLVLVRLEGHKGLHRLANARALARADGGEDRRSGGDGFHVSGHADGQPGHIGLDLAPEPPLGPLFDGFKGVFGAGTAATLLALIGLVGLIASFFTIIYAYGRNTYSLSRAGYFPKWLSLTHGERKTPHVALVAGGIVGYALAVLIYELGKSSGFLAGQIVGALLYMAVFGAVISYAMQCLSFILLRIRLPNIERPYRSLLGIPGAAIAGIIAVVALISLYSNSSYRPGVYGTLIYFLFGIAYFAIAGRHRLVLSPEEEFALTRGEHGHPETEGYGTTHVTDIPADEPVAEQARAPGQAPS